MTLSRIKAGLYPHYSAEDSRVGSSSRRGVNYLCYAATLPPPPESAPVASGVGLEGLVQTPGMQAILARIQARDVGAQAVQQQ